MRLTRLKAVDTIEGCSTSFIKASQNNNKQTRTENNNSKTRKSQRFTLSGVYTMLIYFQKKLPNIYLNDETTMTKKCQD